MKLTFLVTFLLAFSYWLHEPIRKTVLDITDHERFDQPVRFDEWNDLRFSDEKARLDNVSIVWRTQSKNIIYLVVYAGERACVGEAKARGIRAKNYLMKRNVPANKIVWLDGGWRNEVTTTVWIWPREVGKPATQSDLEASEVTFEKGCKIKYRGGRE